MIPKKTIREIRELAQEHGAELVHEWNGVENRDAFAQFSELGETSFLSFSPTGLCFGCSNSGRQLEYILKQSSSSKGTLHLKRYVTQISDNPLGVKRCEDFPRTGHSTAVTYTLAGKNLIVFDRNSAGNKENLFRYIEEMKDKDYNPKSACLQSTESLGCAQTAIKRLLMIRDILNPKSITYCPVDFSFELKVPYGDRNQ